MSRNKEETVSGLTRGYRNNNPGNIEKTYDKDGKQTFWKGEIPGKDPRFKVFKNMAFGYRAMFVTLNSYFSKGFNTIEKIINRWAPPTENISDAYIRAVSLRTGIPANQVLDFKDSQTIKKIVEAISKHENGIEPNIVSINEGLNLFNS